MTKPRKEPTTKRAGKQAPKRSPKRAAPREIQEQNAVSAAACEKAGPEAGVLAMPARSSKKATIIELLQRPNGAAIGDLTAATGWQMQSVHAALTGLRKAGKELVRVKDEGGVTHYRFAAHA